MDILIYHHEFEEGDFPDYCLCCGRDDTTLMPLTLATPYPILGGAMKYQTVEVPLCRAHVKPPWISFRYPSARAFSEEGIVVQNAAPAFVAALEDHRARARRLRKKRGEDEEEYWRARRRPPATPFQPTPENARRYRLFLLALIPAALLLGGGIAGVVLVLVPRGDKAPGNLKSPPAAPHRPPGQGPDNLAAPLHPPQDGPPGRLPRP